MGGRQVLWAQVYLLSQKCEKMEFKLASRPPEDEELMRRRRWPWKTIFISWDNWTERNEHKVTYIITYIFAISALFLPRPHQLQHTWSHSILGDFHASILDSHHYSVGVLESALVLLKCLTCLYPSAWLLMEFQGYTLTHGAMLIYHVVAMGVEKGRLVEEEEAIVSHCVIIFMVISLCPRLMLLLLLLRLS